MSRLYHPHPEWSHLKNTAIAAKSVGDRFYYTGYECQKGHISVRYASSGNCFECIAERREFDRRFRSEGNLIRAKMAIETGVTTYVPEKPCKHGHMERYVSSNNCVKCNSIQMEKRRLSAKWNRVKKLYNLDQESFNKMLLDQGYKCAICKVEIDGGRGTHIDHCHTLGNVRGLLCSRCNQAIGLLDESEEKILSALEYIKNATT